MPGDRAGAGADPGTTGLSPRSNLNFMKFV